MIRVSPIDGTLPCYTDPLTKTGLAGVLAHVARAFPAMSKEALDILRERFIENNFTDQRAMDAVNHVIDSYQGYGACPNIANFIAYDKRIITYSHHELTVQVANHQLRWDDFEPIDVLEELPRWARKEDIRNHRLKRWQVPG